MVRIARCMIWWLKPMLAADGNLGGNGSEKAEDVPGVGPLVT
jgi:hypothetical protein